MKRLNCVYMVVTADEFELPVGIFESVLSISSLLGVGVRAINCAIAEHRKIAKKYFIEIVQDRNILNIAC